MVGCKCSCVCVAVLLVLVHELHLHLLPCKLIVSFPLSRSCNLGIEQSCPFNNVSRFLCASLVAAGLVFSPLSALMAFCVWTATSLSEDVVGGVCGLTVVF